VKPYKARMWALVQRRGVEPVLFQHRDWAQAAKRRNEKVVRVEVTVREVKERKA
jgi:hypothetical protein